MHTISLKEARNIILSGQGLNNNIFGNKKAGTLKVIEHLGYVQIDTISVVERAHHHTIWTRVEDYNKTYLDELIAEKKVFEYWSHAAAFLPMRDYRFTLMRKNLYASGKLKWYFNKRATKFVLDRIKAEGPLQSKDFEENKKRTGWWEWKESKKALEQLFMEGKLMVASRKGFQKVYDLTGRVLPAGVNTTTPTEKEFGKYLVQKNIRANGLAAKSEIGYLRAHAKTAAAKVIAELEEAGEIIPVTVAGVDKEIYYTTPDKLNDTTPKINSGNIKILSPFDNSVIQRNRLKSIFNFDYTIECYVPEKKRMYGYFCLPVLAGDKFVARIDCKADRANGVLLVKNTFPEKDFRPTQKFNNAFEKELKKFAGFNGCSSVDSQL